MEPPGSVAKGSFSEERRGIEEKVLFFFLMVK